MRPVVDGLDYGLVEPRFRTVLFVAIAICGLILAAAGLYALTAFEVARRTREMGIRIALGATGRRLHWFVAADVLRPVIVGTCAGLVLVLWAAQFIRQFLYELNGREPGLYVAAAAILIFSAALAAWLPARRAARTDPAVVLRTP
jgi:ABC-type antimicrobial peptide transport system permease subunit